MKRNMSLFLIVCLSIASGTVLADKSGLNAGALGELQDAGIDKYLGTPPGAGGPDIPWLSIWARQNDWQFQPFYPRGIL